MKSFNILLIAASIVIHICPAGFAQDSILWEPNPKWEQSYDEYKDEKVVYTKIYESVEYKYDEETASLYTENHVYKKIRVNDDNLINQFNKIYIHLSGIIEILDIKARCINPDGKVISFDKENIKEIKDDEDVGSFKIFAIDGIVKGSDIEYYYISKNYADYFGRVYFQFTYPVKESYFKLASPNYLKFDFASYNGLNKIDFNEIDSSNIYLLKSDSIPALLIQKYSYYNPLRMRLEYRLDKNKYMGESQLLTWDNAAQRVYDMIYNQNKKEKKSLTKLLKEITTDKEDDEYANIRKVEDFLKANIVIQLYDIPEFENINYVIKNNITSIKGIVKLYAGLYKQLGIKHNIVLTSDRSQIKFDKEFQSWNYLDQYLIYFPDIDKYLCPSNTQHRLGYVPGELTATDGLFIEPTKFGAYETAIAKTNYIKPLSYELNYDNMFVDVIISDNFERVNVKTERQLNGLSGGYLKQLYKIIDEERKSEFLKSIMQSSTFEVEYTKINAREVKVDQVEWYKGKEPFSIDVEYVSTSLLEKAGNKYLLKVGETIGEQVEMYQDEERKFDVENDFNRLYYREITINIPEGYKITNPEATKLSVMHKENEREIFGFVSDYNYDGQVFKITINECYKNIFCNKEYFEDFRKVINAAADFNKIVLIIEKK